MKHMSNMDIVLTEMKLVRINFKYDGRMVSMFTNLINYYFYMDEKDIVPDFIDKTYVRGFDENEKELIEFDSLEYAIKYESNNGKPINIDCISAYLRVKEAIQNTRKPEISMKILELLKNK